VVSAADPLSGGRSVGIVRSRTKGHGVCFIIIIIIIIGLQMGCQPGGSGNTIQHNK
jgi:hypothetical protein